MDFNKGVLKMQKVQISDAIYEQLTRQLGDAFVDHLPEKVKVDEKVIITHPKIEGSVVGIYESGGNYYVLGITLL